MTTMADTAGRGAPEVKQASAYHHGDLRAALMAAAREALETTSPEAITLKSLAVRLGVSQPAPYRHFNSRDALLAAVATAGFEQFRADLTAAADGASEHEAFERSCLAYLSFGRLHAGLYRLMFASRLLRTAGDDTLKQAASAAFDLLLARISTHVAPSHVRPTALWVWSSLHGLVMLEAEGLTSGPLQEPVSSSQIVRRMVSAVLDREGRSD